MKTLHRFMHKKYSAPLVLAALVLIVGGILGLRAVRAFNGPGSSAGSGSGAIAVDSSNDLAVGTSSAVSGTKLYTLGATSDNTTYALQAAQNNGTAILVVRDDGSVGIDTATPNTATLTVNGSIYASGGFVGTVPAGNVSAGAFPSGNFAFPSSLDVGSSTTTGLPEPLTVNGSGYITTGFAVGTSTLTDANGVVTLNTQGSAGTDVADFSDGVATFSIYVNHNSTGGAGVYLGTLSNTNLAFFTGNGAAKMVLNTSGDVGVNTSTAAYPLTVAGAMQLAASAAPTGANGVIYYDSTSNLFKCYQGGSFVNCINSATSQWTTTSSAIYYSGSAEVGAASAPLATLDVNGYLHWAGTGSLTTAKLVTQGGYLAWNGLTGSSGETDFVNNHGSASATAGGFAFMDTVNAGTPTTTLMYVTAKGFLGIGTTTPTTYLSVGNVTTSLVATFGGGTGKITVGTVDPVYTIGGAKYATYNPGMTGVKEETAGVAMLSPAGGGLYQAVLNFGQAPTGSDVWLFGQVTQIAEHFNSLTVLMTPSFDGSVWYDKDAAHDTLTFLARPASDADLSDLEISYNLTAPRFDSAQWSNYAAPGDPSGFILP